MIENFFFNLNGFSNGIVLSDQSKFDFLSYEDGKAFEPFTYIGIGMSGFKKIKEEYNQPACTCTEFNLRNVFEKNPSEKVIVNHASPLTAEKKDLLFSWYRDGYQKALSMSLQDEIGAIYDTLEVHKKIELLNVFSTYCIKHSFFEGFATQNCLYAIGYIQAFLLKTLKDLQALKYLGFDATSNNNNEINGKPAKSVSPILKNKKGQINVVDEGSMLEIYTIWSILITDSEEFGSPITIKEELNFLLNHFFYCKDFKLTHQKSFELKLFGTAHRDLIDFLMRLSKKINNDKLNNEAYCIPLMQTLKDVYKNVDSVETLSKNWANNNNKIMKRIANKLDNDSEVYLTIVRAIRKGNLEHLLPKIK